MSNELAENIAFLFCVLILGCAAIMPLCAMTYCIIKEHMHKLNTNNKEVSE